jgi:hypothetical protein
MHDEPQRLPLSTGEPAGDASIADMSTTHEPA